MKKIGRSGLLLLLLAAVCVIILSLAGCNDDPAPGPDEPVKGKGSVTVMEPDGTVLKTQSGSEGDAFDFLPERPGYRSYGVYSDEDCTEAVSLPTALPKGEAVYYVRFENPISYRVSFSGGEGVGEMAGLSLVYGERTALPKNTFTYAGRTFSEWRLYAEDGSYSSFVDGAKVKNLTTVDGAKVKNLTTVDGASLTLVAIFETADSVNFTVADGVVTAYTGNAETEISERAPTRSGRYTRTITVTRHSTTERQPTVSGSRSENRRERYIQSSTSTSFSPTPSSILPL